jgi:hypothetical protein
MTSTLASPSLTALELPPTVFNPPASCFNTPLSLGTDSGASISEGTIYTTQTFGCPNLPYISSYLQSTISLPVDCCGPWAPIATTAPNFPVFPNSTFSSNYTIASSPTISLDSSSNPTTSTDPTITSDAGVSSNPTVSSNSSTTLSYGNQPLKASGQLCPVGYEPQTPTIHGASTTAVCCPTSFAGNGVYCWKTGDAAKAIDGELPTATVSILFALEAVWDSQVTSALHTTVDFSYGIISTAAPVSTSSASSQTPSVTYGAQIEAQNMAAQRRFVGGLVGGILGFMILTWIIMALALWLYLRHRRFEKDGNWQRRNSEQGSQTDIFHTGEPLGATSIQRPPVDFIGDIGIAHGGPDMWSGIPPRRHFDPDKFSGYSDPGTSQGHGLSPISEERPRWAGSHVIAHA